MNDFDTSLLGLKFELIDHLSENDIHWFQHFQDVEANLTEGSLRILWLSDFTDEHDTACLKWARKNGFKFCFSEEAGKAIFTKKRK